MKEIKKILFISLSNIGDAILTLPALDLLLENFPEAKVTVMTGERPKEIFSNSPCISKVVVYDKRASLIKQAQLFLQLKKERFDLVVDLRSSFFGLMLPAPFKPIIFSSLPKEMPHKRAIHLNKALTALRDAPRDISLGGKKYFFSQEKNSGKENEKIIVISPGARSHTKRWPQDKFIELINALNKEFSAKIVLVGNRDDLPITRYIAERVSFPVLNLAGLTDFQQLAVLLKKASLLITNDSAVMHLASYLNIPVVAIFGPTNELKYGPWAEFCAVAKKEIFCRPCEKAQCRFGTLACLHAVKVGDVMRQVRNVLVVSRQSSVVSPEEKFKRILIVRTDRIGDVLLSTPVIKTLRDNFPHAYIAMMVSPYAKEIVENNPFLDEVIVLDKDRKHKSWFSQAKFACNLRRRQFDLAIILHPTLRVHLLCFFSGIPRRIGYDKKGGFWLTDRVEHLKQLGEKHELEYNLELLKVLGIDEADAALLFPIRPESEQYAQDLFAKEGITKADKILAIHPGASCPSKIWPNERFAEVADILAHKYGLKIIIIAGPKDIYLAKDVLTHMHTPAIDLGGKTSVSQLASILKRCSLFISNDSGPVHVATAVGTPVISIFGRKQAGLGPKRWGPRGERSVFLHRDVGCVECLAHNCIKEFACLKAITVDDVVALADSILKT